MLKTALVIGRSQSVWDEIAEAERLGPYDYTIVTGPTVADYPGYISHWVWFHVELFAHVAQRRAANGFAPVGSYWGLGNGRKRTPANSKINFLDWRDGGSSGLIAVLPLALQTLHVDRVVLAGIPMQAEAGKYDTGKPWDEAEKHRHAWIKHLPNLQGRVRSFSGWTRELLGGEPPTEDWLRADAPA